MEIKIIASGMGLAIPKTNFGVNLMAGMYLQVRNNSKEIPTTYGIAKSPSIGGKSGTLLVSHVETEWMQITPGNHGWLSNQAALTGCLAEAEVKGTLVASGNVDVTIKIYGPDNEAKYSFNKIAVKASGGQLASTAVRGQLKRMPKKAA